eukprot:12290254-Alexandrium_andersonii.AAC.1
MADSLRAVYMSSKLGEVLVGRAYNASKDCDVEDLFKASIDGLLKHDGEATSAIVAEAKSQFLRDAPTL